jgi:hypothetical protein
VAAAISPYITGSLNHVMKQIDGGTGGGYIYKVYLEDLDRHRKQLPSKTTPNFAVLARVLELEQPSNDEVITADKSGDGILAVWKQGQSALAYGISWGRTVHAVFENSVLTVEPKRLVYKDFEVPALQLRYPQFRSPAVIVGVMARTPKDFNASKAKSCLDQMSSIIKGEATD